MGRPRNVIPIATFCTLLGLGGLLVAVLAEPRIGWGIFLVGFVALYLFRFLRKFRVL